MKWFNWIMNVVLGGMGVWFLLVAVGVDLSPLRPPNYYAMAAAIGLLCFRAMKKER